VTFTRRIGVRPPVGRVAAFAALPPFAAEYIEAQRPAEPVVRLFHKWLNHSYRPLLQLESRELDAFLCSIERSSMPSRKQARYRHLALRYFDWLHGSGLLGFDPRYAWPRSNFPLPPEAQRFLETLEPTHKLSTVRGYQTTLRQFHIWLNAEKRTFHHLKRVDLESWLRWLHVRGLHACTRVHSIQQVRTYLEWLEEQHVLPADSSQGLLRSTDLPKLPQYLPRPLPPEIDTVLQQRLRKPGCRYQRALLLMRWTGLRIGELIALEYDCVRHDARGIAYLKVPLGKLNNERLVPINEKTLKLVLKLRRTDRRKRKLLLQGPTGVKVPYDRYRQALAKACRGLVLAEPVTTHRLRHTFATTLLAGGMSLPALMRVLGHRDHRMTLRYAAVTDELVASEFSDALGRSAERYKTALPAAASSTIAPAQLLADAARHLAKSTLDESVDKLRAKALLKRLRRLDADVRKLLRHKLG
jgi:site-specific recombinase XerD